LTWGFDTTDKNCYSRVFFLLLSVGVASSGMQKNSECIFEIFFNLLRFFYVLIYEDWKTTKSTLTFLHYTKHSVGMQCQD